METVNYLDVTFNLNGGHLPTLPKTRQQSNTYMSNLTINIIKKIFKTIERSLSHFFCNEKIFNKSATADKLQQINYNPVNTKIPNKRNHKRNIWFNPLSVKNVSTNMAKIFLNLLDKHFPQSQHIHKIFTRNSVEVTYSCPKSMKIIINNHN